MKLDKRMSAILSEIPPKKNLADIGADHGYIGISYAIANCDNIVVGSDISQKSIQKAAQTAKKHGLQNYITRVGDGLHSISDLQVDVILISGLGGEEMIKILNEGKRYSLYVLSPQKNVDKLRKFLSEQNLLPQKDYKVLSEDKFYDIIVASDGKYSPSEFQLQFGSGVGKDFEIFAEQTKNRLTNLLEMVVNSEEKQNIMHKLQLLTGNFR